MTFRLVPSSCAPGGCNVARANGTGIEDTIATTVTPADSR